MRKIIDGIAIAAGAGVIAILGGVAYGFFWFQGNQDRLTEIAIEKVKGSLGLPGLSGPALAPPPRRQMQIPRAPKF